MTWSQSPGGAFASIPCMSDEFGTVNMKARSAERSREMEIVRQHYRRHHDALKAMAADALASAMAAAAERAGALLSEEDLADHTADWVSTIHTTYAGAELQALGYAFNGDVENYDFIRLVIAARLPASEVTILRAYVRYMRQIGFALS